MTEVVVGVRLTADGSGLVGQLKLSREEFEQLRNAEKGAAESARALANETSTLTAQIAATSSQAEKATGTIARADTLTDKLSVTMAKAAAQASNMSSSVQQSGQALGRWSSDGMRWITGAEAMVAAGGKVTAMSGMQRAGMQQLSFQLNDMATMYAMGARPMQIFASQIGQVTQAVQMLSGGTSKLATFLGSPWVMLVGTAAVALTPLIAKLLETKDALDEVGNAAQQAMAKLMASMRQTSDISATATEMTKSIATSSAEIVKLNREIANTETALAVMGPAFGDADASAGLYRRLADLEKRKAAAERDLKQAQSGMDDLRALATASRVQDENKERLGDKPSKPRKSRTGDAAREAERLANFSERAEEAVARINDEYNTAPRDIDRARQATAQLDGVIRDINKKLATGKALTQEQREKFEATRASAEALKPVIQDSLIRPLTDMLVIQERDIELGWLRLAGREADAEALQLTYTLMDKLGAESEDQLATELAKRGVTADQVRQLYGNLAVMREQTNEMRGQRELQQAFLTSIGDMRENFRLTLESIRSDGPKALGDFMKRSLDVADRLFADVMTEKLFGGLFRDLEDQITGGDKVSRAGDKMAKAVEKASADIASLGTAASGAAAAMTGRAISGADGTTTPDAQGGPGENEILVSAVKDLKVGFAKGYDDAFDDLKGGLEALFHGIFGEGGVFSESLGRTLGKSFANAQTGAMFGSVTGSSTGGAIGGALGGKLGEKFLTKGLESLLPGLGQFAGPLGSIAGGLLGGVVGGMLKKTKTGAANITSVDGDATLSGNSSKFKAAASGAADSVQSGLQQIAEMLGGDVGGFNVTIGQRHGDWRVRSGTGSLKVAKGAKEFDDDQAGAMSYAISLAISQGAVTGLSAAVQKAIKSSTDIDKALEEALKVQDLELLLGGIGAELEKSFRDFDRQAQERLRIARQYGFDVVKVEEQNAKDRLKLTEDLLASQIGSLQDLIDEMTSGSLFEGTSVEKRDALLVELAKAKADVDAGAEGAADKYADLLQQLNEVSKEVYGTTGGFASDRDMILAQARDTIARAEQRINDAQARTSDPALATTNAALDENNDQNAQMLASLGISNELLQKLLAQISASNLAAAAVNGWGAIR